MEVIAKTGSEAYVKLLWQVLDKGDMVSPRGQLTFEVPDVTVIVEDLAEAHVLNTVRRVSPKILATEYMHLLGGISSLEQLDLASGGRFSQFANDGRLMGAYGPRIRHQLPRVVDCLTRDPDTRQAVLTIWNGKEHAAESRDTPCTLTLQFRLRDDRLSVRVNMRSSDVILGAPYDWFMFSRLAMSVASVLGVELGSFILTTGSMHLYDRDLGIANDVQEAGVLAKPRFAVPPALTHTGTEHGPSWRTRQLMQMAEDICLSDDLPDWDDDYVGVDWYLAHVPRLSDVSRCRACYCVFKSSDVYPEDWEFCKVCG